MAWLELISTLLKCFITLTGCKWLIWWKIVTFVAYSSHLIRFLGYFLLDICISCGQCPCIRGENNSLWNQIVFLKNFTLDENCESEHSNVRPLHRLRIFYIWHIIWNSDRKGNLCEIPALNICDCKKCAAPSFWDLTHFVRSLI